VLNTDLASVQTGGELGMVLKPGSIPKESTSGARVKPM